MAALAVGVLAATVPPTAPPPSIPPSSAPLVTSVVTTAPGPPATVVDTSFLRGVAEGAAVLYFADATGGTVTQVACAPPPADEGGAQFVCFALDASGEVVAAEATVDDYGTPVFDPLAAPNPDATTPTTVSDVVGTYAGTGPQLVVVEALTGPHVVTLTHAGAAAFSVQSMSNGADVGSPLVNLTGAFTGRVVLNGPGTVDAFRITADGAWTLEVRTPTAALTLTPGASVTGDGTDVVSWADPSPVNATFSFTGATAFSIVAVAPGGNTSLASGSGPLDGSIAIPAGPGFIQVTTDGPWTITAPPAPPASTP